MTASASLKIFISYTQTDRAWAEWIAWQLRENGYEVTLQAWHFGAGSNFVHNMQRATRESDQTVVVLSPDYEGSEFGFSEWAAAFVDDATGKERKLVPVRIAPCQPTGLLRALVYIDLVGLDENAARQRLLDEIGGPQEPDAEPPFPEPEEPSQPKETSRPFPGKIATSRLLDLGVTDRFEELVGREDERRLLTDAWNDDGVHVLVFVAEGGVGKTSLVADWLMDFVNAGWTDVDAFFDWSFYSQGTRDQSAANSGQFFDAALRHFGEEELADSPAAADEKAGRLAQIVAERRTLLVLDGVEPLQHPRQRAGLDGRFKDLGVERLLKRLAQMPGGGLCVVTTRVPVVDLTRFHGGTVREHPLDHLSEEAAARLLHQAGVRRAGEAEIGPENSELRTAARELDGHALSVQLLGGYLKHAHGGDVRRRDRVDWKQVFDEQQEGHAWSVMRAYERWFEQHGDAGRRPLAALRLLGFFDRPASAAYLEALRTGEVIPGLTEPLVGLRGEDWKSDLTRLADEHRLISIRGGGQRPELDSHPLVREYFAQQLHEEHPTAWTEGHRRLYEHLCKTTKHRPDTLEGLQPLYQAVAHGCQAGLHQQALKHVFVDRILRGTGLDANYSVFKLGAFGPDLGALACFFDRPWNRLSSNLSAAWQAWLLNQTAFCLRALGRLTEAVEPMKTGLEKGVEQGNWQISAIIASNLSELELTLGEVSTAIDAAEQSVAWADQSGHSLLRVVSRTASADALRQTGRCGEARRLFAEAETMQAERQQPYPQLYSLQGFRYCDLLLSDAERAAWCVTVGICFGDASTRLVLRDCDQVTMRASQIFEWRKLPLWDPTADPLLDLALDHLTLARAALYKWLAEGGIFASRPSGLTQHLTAAVDGLRKAGTADHLPRSLLTRAWHRRVTGDAKGAASDLDEAWEIAERGPMPLYQADILLTHARLFFRDDLDTARQNLAEARRLIEKHGYHRRDEELADAEEVLGAATVLG